MKKRAGILALALLMLALPAGCGAEAVELSDEDTKRVADYSSDILSQHNQYSNSRLADVEEVKWEYQKQLDLEVKKKNFIAQQRAAGMLDDGQEGGDGSDGGGSAEGQAAEEELPVMPLEEALDLGGASIRYTGHEVVNSYPSAQENADVIMGMTAAQGDRLVVLHFELSNPSDADILCDVLSGRPQFRIKINGQRHTLQQTILPNDLSKFTEVIPAGGTADTVLISEVEAAKAENITDLSLIVRSAEGRPEYKLEGSGSGGEASGSSEPAPVQDTPDIPIPDYEGSSGDSIDFDAEEPYGILTYEMPQQQ